MVNFLGKDGNLALFSNGELAVVVDTSLNLIADIDSESYLSTIKTWSTEDSYFPEESFALANAALTASAAEEPVVASAKRKYTIPGGVQAEAKKALKWRKEHKRGGTPVGLNTARTLAKGGQIGLEKIRHIAKYFPRHEVDKQGKGWAPGEKNYPSNGRIAWALWGGDAAWRWARAIVERENKKAMAAGGYMEADYLDHLDLDNTEARPVQPDLNAFKLAHELDMTAGPEFMARIRMDGSGIDRLYKIEIDGSVFVWDDCSWDDLGHVDGDIYTYDAALDDPYDTVEKDYVLIDPSSAVIISAFFQERPFQAVTLDEIDPQEAQLMADGLAEEDFVMIDRVITAAGINPNDGVDTPEEKAERAKKQPKDALGRFAKVGTEVAVAGDLKRGKGKISRINAKDGSVDVLLNNGKLINVPANQTTPLDGLDEGLPVQEIPSKPLDVSGILGQPRTPSNMPKAHLPGTMKPITGKDIQVMLNNWEAFVKDMRESYKKPVTSAGEKESVQTPESTDVPPKYLAIVSPDDLSAVMDLVAIVPKTATSTSPMVYERKDGKWVPNEQILLDLKSATPPPVVELDDKKVLDDVLKQVDNIPVTAALLRFWEKKIDPILAAGGLDRNRGNAEELRRYWTRGEGALKIRWGTPGDWTRCVRFLSKYMGPRAKGYCQLRHKEVTGVYTGSRLNPGKRGINASGLFDSLEQMTEQMIKLAALSARAADARQKIGLVAAAPKPAEGAKFRIPLLIPEDLESGDGRKFKKDSLSVRELPIPLLWQIKTGDGHAGSVVVGRIDSVERTEQGLGNAYGVFDTGVYGQEAERLVKNGFLRGVSADLDQFEAKEEKANSNAEAEDDGEVGKDKLTVNRARVMAATIVAKPAFQECTIAIDYEGDQEDDMTPIDGVYEETIDTPVEPIVASGFLDGEIPVTPPTEWFENPKLTKPTPLTVDPSGRIYGHIAAWHVNHIGMPRSTRPPRSRSKYAYFHTGVVRTAEGKDIPVGQLTLAGGHAPLSADARSAAKHYDDTASAIADVHAGEDDYGIWVSGSLRPDATEMQIRALRASAPSGDWRPINGSLELVAVCQVNVPGFPIARALVASGKVMALVAAGASFLAIMKSDAVASLAARADQLGQLAATAPNLKARVKSKKSEVRQQAITAAATKAEELRERALVAAAVAELAKFSEEERKDLAEKGMALPDGSYPIRNEQDLKNAIRAYGRSNPKDRAKVRSHIRKRAKALGKVNLVPEEWKAAASMDAAEMVERMRETITASAQAVIETPAETTASYLDVVKSTLGVDADPKASSYLAVTASTDTEFAKVAEEEISEEDLKKLKEAKEEADKQTEEEIKAAEEVKANRGDLPERDEDGRMKYVSGVNQPRDAKGKYRKVLARLKQDLGVAGLSKALKKVEEAENLDFAGDYAASAGASSELLGMIDRLDAKALNPEALENVRATAAELGKTIANLPLPFGSDTSKLRFSDLPAGLKDLIEKMITRVESKIGKEDADIATANLKSYMSGADVYSQAEVQSEMSKLLRLLT